MKASRGPPGGRPGAARGPPGGLPGASRALSGGLGAARNAARRRRGNLGASRGPPGGLPESSGKLAWTRVHDFEIEKLEFLVKNLRAIIKIQNRNLSEKVHKFHRKTVMVSRQPIFFTRKFLIFGRQSMMFNVSGMRSADSVSPTYLLTCLRTLN